jgi:hypothetical protein
MKGRMRLTEGQKEEERKIQKERTGQTDIVIVCLGLRNREKDKDGNTEREMVRECGGEKERKTDRHVLCL